MKNNFVYLLLCLLGNAFGLWAQTNPLNPVIYPAFNGTNTGAIEQTLPPSVAGVDYIYNWYQDGSGESIGNTLNIYHLTPGNYTLHMSRAGWCSPAKYNYTIPSATNMGIQIYPNPATNQLTASGHPTTHTHFLLGCSEFVSCHEFHCDNKSRPILQSIQLPVPEWRSVTSRHHGSLTL